MIRKGWTTWYKPLCFDLRKHLSWSFFKATLEFTIVRNNRIYYLDSEIKMGGRKL